MNCPKCGTQNRDEAEICSVCRGPLTAASLAPDGRTAKPPAFPTGDTSQAVVSQRTSGLAIASLVLSITGILCVGVLAWPISVILGFIALSKIKKQPGLFKGRGLAIGGIITSSVLFFLSIILSVVLILMPALGKAREMAEEIMCASQLNGIGKAFMMYQNDFDGQNPPDLQALVETVDVDASVLVCPCTDDKEGEISYIYRGADLDSSAPGDMILAYDKHENHPNGSINILFAGIHVQRCSKEKLQAAVARDNELRRELGLPEKPIE